MARKHMKASEFIRLARFVAENHPSREIKARGHVSCNEVRGILSYKDDVIRIKAGSRPENPELEVTRWENMNPTTIVWEDGRCIRHHGEHCYLTEHLETLCDEIDPNWRKENVAPR